MSTCPHGHPVPASVAFCHECGAAIVRPTLAHTNRPLYVSIASVVVIVLGLFAIVWVLNDQGTEREAAASEGSISVCGLAPEQRPTSIALACGSSGALLTDLTWTQWTDQSATGTGTYSASGDPERATVVLSGAARTAAGLQFTQMTVTPRNGEPVHQRIAVYAAGSSVSTISARVPLGGTLCPAGSERTRRRLGVIGKHTSCDFADQVRRAYLAAGGHGQGLRVTATSTITHRTYRDIACAAGTYVVCVGGEDNTAQVFFGPF